MSRKIQIVLPDPQADQLTELAAGAGAGEPQSTLAGLLVRTGIAQAAKDGKVRPLKQAPVVSARAASARVGLSLRRRPGLAGGDVGSDRRLARSLPSRARQPQRRLVDRRTAHRDPLRTRRLAHRNRRHRRRPTRRASPSKPSSTTTPTPSAKKAAASQRHGNQEHHPTDGADASALQRAYGRSFPPCTTTLAVAFRLRHLS